MQAPRQDNWQSIVAIRLIVGLGNPGPEFAGTRHNIGADWLEALAWRANIPLKSESRLHGLLGRGVVADRDVRLLVPTTFMNRSGLSVAATANYFKIEPEEILVAYDEMAFEPGVIRLKTGGGAGGHNGIRDLIDCLGKAARFHRLRIGVGHPGSAAKVTRYLTQQKMPESERGSIEEQWRLSDVLPLLLAGDFENAMNRLHAPPPSNDNEQSEADKQ